LGRKRKYQQGKGNAIQPQVRRGAEKEGKPKSSEHRMEG